MRVQCSPWAVRSTSRPVSPSPFDANRFCTALALGACLLHPGASQQQPSQTSVRDGWRPSGTLRALCLRASLALPWWAVARHKAPLDDDFFCTYPDLLPAQAKFCSVPCTGLLCASVHHCYPLLVHPPCPLSSCIPGTEVFIAIFLVHRPPALQLHTEVFIVRCCSSPSSGLSTPNVPYPGTFQQRVASRQ
jgi:hypothetical protein